MPRYDKIATFSDEGFVRMVVEAPRGSRGKFAYDASTGTFTLSKSLTLGLTYPFDWGFIPSTLGEDGDPLDAMALHDVSTFPGMVLLCKPIGAVRMSQRAKGKRETNDRLLFLPVTSKRSDDVSDARQLSRELRAELEEFFKETDAGETRKEVRIEGWAGPKEAKRLVHRGERAFRKRER